jgi:hypothetical protein
MSLTIRATRVDDSHTEAALATLGGPFERLAADGEMRRRRGARSLTGSR